VLYGNASAERSAAVFQPLREQRQADITVGDVGALAVVLYALEVEDASLINR
jgi:hypothetical protein